MNRFEPKDLLARVGRLFSGFTPGQRVVTGVAALAVVERATAAYQQAIGLGR